MFDFSFTEMLLAGVVALVVLGPEKLPKVARFAGEWVGKIQRMAAGIKSELSNHADYTEMMKIKQDVEQTANEIRADLRDLNQQMEQNQHEWSEKWQENVPAWERLPKQKNPADFGIFDDAGSLHNPSTGTIQTPSLRKQAMKRKRDMRPRHRPTPKFRSRR